MTTKQIDDVVEEELKRFHELVPDITNLRDSIDDFLRSFASTVREATVKQISERIDYEMAQTRIKIKNLLQTNI